MRLCCWVDVPATVRGLGAREEEESESEVMEVGLSGLRTNPPLALVLSASTRARPAWILDSKVATRAPSHLRWASVGRKERSEDYRWKRRAR